MEWLQAFGFCLIAIPVLLLLLVGFVLVLKVIYTVFGQWIFIWIVASGLIATMLTI